MTTEEVLELVPTTALVEALASRYDSVVLLGHSQSRTDGMVATTRVNWKGDANVCLALAARVTHQINAFLDDQPDVEHDDT